MNRIAFLALLLSTSALHAAAIESESKIDAVAVYPDAAIVTRIATVDIPKGSHVLAVRGLPRDVDLDSIRVSATSTGDLHIGSVEDAPIPTPQTANNGVDRAKLAALEAQRAEAMTVKERIGHKRDFLLKYASAPVASDKEVADTSKWADRWKPIEDGLAAVDADALKADQKIADLDAQIEGVKAVLSTSLIRNPSAAPKRAKRDLVVAIDAGDDVKHVEFHVSYRVSNAHWTPVYDADLTSPDGGKPTLSLSRRAIVQQSSDEAWNDVKLTISSSPITRTADLPTIGVVHARSFDPRQQAQQFDANLPIADENMTETTLGSSSGGPSVMVNAMRATAAMPASAPIAVAADERQARLDSHGWNASFEVEGRLSVPADGGAKSVLLSRETDPTEVEVSTVPELAPAAYVRAKFAFKGDSPLFGGAAVLSRDGTVIGKARIEFTAPGDKVSLGFGPDDQIKVSRVTVRDEDVEPGTLSFDTTRTLTREYKQTIKNLHKDKRTVTLYDRLPISEQHEVKIMRVDTAPSGWTEVSAQPGVSTLKIEIAPGEEKEIRTGYTVNYPGKQTVNVGR